MRNRSGWLQIDFRPLCMTQVDDHHARPRPRDPAWAAQAAWPQAALVRCSFSPSELFLWSKSGLMCLGFLKFFFGYFGLCMRLKFFWVRNRVLETRFPCGRYVEKYATSDMIRPWKSSLWDSIYWPKSSLLDSRC